MDKLQHPNTPAAGYEPPRIEKVLAPEDLERELLFAGPQVPSPPV